MSVRDLKSSSRTNWERIDAMSDGDIDISDVSPLDDEFFSQAQLRLPHGKVPVVMSVDAEVFRWFRSQGDDYQELINQALRIYAEEHAA